MAKKDRPKELLLEEPRSGSAYVMRVPRTEIRFAVIKATLIAIRGTRGSLYQKIKKDDETTDVDYNIVALDCDRNED